MNPSFFFDPGLTVALALILGMVAQSLAHYLRIPGIVLLLAAGVVFGPDGLGLIKPESLGIALNILTGFAVAVILFAGGVNLKYIHVRSAKRAIRGLIIVGGFLTIVGASLSIHLVMHWPLESAFLFGTLVMVTGPTVINPLLKRLKVKRTVATVLETEGVLIDVIGAIVAMVALEAVMSPHTGSTMRWIMQGVYRLGFGALAGCLIGFMLLVLYRKKRLVPEEVKNVFTLAVILALFQTSNLILSESGIAAVTVAGIIVGNYSEYDLRDLAEFKEEMSVLFIGMLFVLLTADVRVSHVVSLGWPAVGVVLILMFLIRPAAVMAGTGFSELNWKERSLISWIGPRGIVAAAVASYFSAALSARGLPGGNELRAMVFMVIAITVVFSGLTAGGISSILGLRRKHQEGWVILGACALARSMARLFRDDGQEVVLIDSNANNCEEAEGECTNLICGNGLQRRCLLQSKIDTRKGALALTTNDEVNYLFMQKAKDESRDISLWSVLKSDWSHITVKMIRETGADIAFGIPLDVEIWNRRLELERAHMQLWRCEFDTPLYTDSKSLLNKYSGDGILSLAVRRNKVLSPIGEKTRFREDDEVYFCFFEPEIEAASEFLNKSGWRYVKSVEKYTDRT